MTTLVDNIKDANMSSSNTPKFDRAYLDGFEAKVRNGTTSLSDYLLFDINLKSLGISDLLKNELKRYDIYSFEQLISEQKKDKNDPTRNKYIDSGVIGIFSGLINGLRSIIK